MDVTGKDAEQTLWLDAHGIERAADDLARVEKGRMISAMGRVTRGTFAGKDGPEPEFWTRPADAIITARSRRPGQRRPS
jgi:single-strand DNA-binding protein